MPQPKGPGSRPQTPDAMKANPDAGLNGAVDKIRQAKNPKEAINTLKSEQANLETSLGEKATTQNKGVRTKARARLKVIELQLLALQNPKLSTKQVVNQYKKVLAKRKRMISKMFG